jgi:hypothetical protein
MATAPRAPRSRPAGRPPIAAIAAVLALACACGQTSGGPDSTPPGFAQVTVSVQHVANGVTEPPIDATNGLTLTGAHRDTRVIVRATAGDQESGVRAIELEGEATWTCHTPGEELAEAKRLVFTKASDEAIAGTAASGSPAARSSTFTRDAFAGPARRLMCPPLDDASALTFKLTPSATNGNGATATLPPIVITYVSRPAAP